MRSRLLFYEYLSCPKDAGKYLKSLWTFLKNPSIFLTIALKKLAQNWHIFFYKNHKILIINYLNFKKLALFWQHAKSSIKGIIQLGFKEMGNSNSSFLDITANLGGLKGRLSLSTYLVNERRQGGKNYIGRNWLPLRLKSGILIKFWRIFIICMEQFPLWRQGW